MDLAEHLKTVGKDKALRDLLAKDERETEDALREYELPPRASRKEHDPTLDDLLHKMHNLALEVNQLKDLLL